MNIKTLFAGLIVLFTMSGCVSIPNEAFASGRIAIGTTQTQLRPVTSNYVGHNTPVDSASQAAYDKEVDKVAKSIQKRKDCIARNKAWTDHGAAPKYRCGAKKYPAVRWTRSGNTLNSNRQYRYRSAYSKNYTRMGYTKRH